MADLTKYSISQLITAYAHLEGESWNTENGYRRRQITEEQKLILAEADRRDKPQVLQTMEKYTQAEDGEIFLASPPKAAASYGERYAVSKFGQKTVNRLKRLGITFISTQLIPDELGAERDGFQIEDHGVGKIWTTEQVLAKAKE